MGASFTLRCWLSFLVAISSSLANIEDLVVIPDIKPDDGRSYLPEVSRLKVEDAFSKTQVYENLLRQLEIKMGKEGTVNPYRISATARHLTQVSSSQLARRLDHLAGKFEEATRLVVQSANLTVDQIALLSDIDTSTYADTSAMDEWKETYFGVNCEDNRYRSADGSCNNLFHVGWGKAGTCARRILPACYHDGISEPRRAFNGKSLPNPRLISSTVHQDVSRPNKQTTHLLMTFGQFLDHDLTLTPAARTEDDGLIDCCSEVGSSHPACLPITIPEDDPFYSKYRFKCINFVRSARCPTGQLSARTQINLLTTFVDASNVYGSSINETRSLRTLNGNGQLLTQRNNLLPPSLNPATDQCSRPQDGLLCFRAGDVRLNQQSYLVTMHTIFMRQHNRVARELQILNPDWDDEKLFQEARRIVGAQMQKIVFDEYVAHIIGPKLTDYFGLRVQNTGFTTYNPNTDPSIISEFTTAAYRFGHSQIQSFFAEIFANGTTIGYHLKDIFFNPFRIYDGQMDGIIRGLTRQLAQASDQYFTKDVTNHLYQAATDRYGMDLPAININRGRDHGLRPYVEYLNACFGLRVSKFKDLDRLMPVTARKRFQSLYKKVADIDLYSGSISEYNLPEASVGPTFGCIIGYQFRNLKFGDRYYFEHRGQTGSFNAAQLEQLRKTSFARILCANSDNVKEIQPRAFEPVGPKNPLIPCDYLPDLDLTVWQQGSPDDSTNPLPPMIPIIPLE